MEIAIVAAGFTPGEADLGAPLHGRVAASRADWSSSATSCSQGMLDTRLHAAVRQTNLSADPGLRQLWLP